MSAKVSRKAYVFTRRIPEVMQFTAHPRCAYWPEIFQLDCPDANDIALYFYPVNFERFVSLGYRYQIHSKLFLQLKMSVLLVGQDGTILSC